MAIKIKKADVMSSLQEQLAFKGAALNHYEDLLNDYMDLWDVKNALITDIKKRGVTYTDNSSVGVKMQKNNPSVKELVMVNKQMLFILRELGLSTEAAGEISAEDEL